MRFFAIESTYPEPTQIAWIEQQLKASADDWKVVFVHHPLYSSGGRHGSDIMLRKTLEPLFIRYNVRPSWWGKSSTIRCTSTLRFAASPVHGADRQFRAPPPDARR